MGDLSNVSAEQPFNLDEVRQRLMKMSDAVLREVGEAARYMCSPAGKLGKPPREELVIQLRKRARSGSADTPKK
jgi:hypothetical protein